ncbi:MAG: N-acetylmuramoyl-L-alanine amidase, partial [Oscillospiraceae bacterium]|nr:N-acetylmuramoyl-L-alanine amidase [Oscillospiraceae bacterium]
MKKRVFLTTLIIFFTILFVFIIITNFTGFGHRYIDKEQTIRAAVVRIDSLFAENDSEDVFKVKVRELADFLGDNKLNTVIVPFNDGHSAIADATGFVNIYTEPYFVDKKDSLTLLSEKLAMESIQTVLRIDCADFTAEELQATVEQLNRQYALSGIILSGYTHSGEQLQNIKMSITQRYRQYWFGVETQSLEYAAPLQSFGAVDFYLVDNLTESDYRSAKEGSFTNEKIFLQYTSPTFLSDLFVISNFGGCDGVVLTEYTTPDKDLSLYHNLMDTTYSLQNFGYYVKNGFSITNPKQNWETYSEGVYVTGVADPSTAVYVNANAVMPAKDGTYGYFVQLDVGDNLIEVIQGDDRLVRKVVRKTYKKDSLPVDEQEDNTDGTEEAEKGQIIQTKNDLTSILADYKDESSIIDGVPQGVQLVVEKSVAIRRNGKDSWAYMLSNGGYVFAENVEWVEEENYTKPQINSAGQIAEEKSGDVTLALEIGGRPAVISDFNEETLQLVFLDTLIPQEFLPENWGADEDTETEEDTDKKEENVSDEQQSEDEAEDKKQVTVPVSFDGAGIVSGFSWHQDGKNAVLTIDNTAADGIWGYNVQYPDTTQEQQDNVFTVYFKKTPHKSSGTLPLKGITVMLDAGHGGTDPGALPVGGVDGPAEKDLNLAVTLATKQCLEKLGATVKLTRSDDIFYTLQERRDMVGSEKPDLFIALHHNSMDYTVDSSKTFGFESYYFTPQSKALAEIMTDRISQVTQRNNRGHHYGYYYVLRNDIAPCVLNEYGFVVNPYEYSTLYRDQDIYKAA